MGKNHAAAGLPQGWHGSAQIELERYKRFVARFRKRVPHSDTLPNVFLEAPEPSITFDYKTALSADPGFADLSEKMGKVFFRLRAVNPDVVACWAFGDDYFSNVTHWNRDSNETLWGDVGPKEHFENLYFLSEDASFGLGLISLGGKVVFWGTDILKMINSNRVLWPKFWKKLAMS